MITIKKTTEEALNQAKINCIRQFEKKYDISVGDETFVSNEHIWLEKNTSVQC
jgi:hypothetical protein